MMIGSIMALVVASPYIVYQIWAFIGGALKPSKKNSFDFWRRCHLFFFLSGGAFAYFVAVPMAYQFLDEFLFSVYGADGDR